MFRCFGGEKVLSNKSTSDDYDIPVGVFSQGRGRRGKRVKYPGVMLLLIAIHVKVYYQWLPNLWGLSDVYIRVIL